jgi:exopolysaccharide biosynthesis polyprenyl glycosylphosphotransferase
MKSSILRDILPARDEVVSNKRSWISQKFLWPLYLLLLVSSDLFLMVQAYRLAFFFRFQAAINIFQLDVIPSEPFYSSLVILLVPLWIITFTVVGLYSRHNLLGGTKEYALVFRACTVGLLLLIILGFLQPAIYLARGWTLLAWIFSFLFVASGRLILRRGVYALRRIGFFQAPTVIIGANQEGISLAQQLLSWPTSGLNLVGFVDQKYKSGTELLEGLRVLGPVDHLSQIIRDRGIEHLVFAASAFSTHDNLVDVYKNYGFNPKTHIHISSGLYEIITTGLTVNEYAYVPLVSVNRVRLTETERIQKLLLELSLIIPLMIILGPILLLIALAIRIESPGSVLYRRRVMGVNGRQFSAFKFRTMYINGDEILARHPELQEELERNQKLKNDPRVTRVGRILRKFSLDELPQFLNVLRMEMALVGPRMISPEEMKLYSQWGFNLLTVRPGITGLWQVSGRSDITYQERVRLDMYYIRNWSILLDLQIIWRTLPAILKGKGAY